MKGAALSSDDLFAGLFTDLTAAENPTVPTSQAVSGSDQATDRNDVSRYSRISHAENGGLAISDRDGRETGDFRPAGSRVASYHVSEVGSAGNVGTGAKTLAASDTSLFPPPSLSVGKEKDKWEVPVLPADPVPIPSTTIRAAVEREVAALAALGIDGPDAEARAVAIVRAKVGNSEVLAERQQNGAACHVCGGRLDDDAPVVAVLSGKPKAHLYLHAACHDAYRNRRRALVDRVMADAGFVSEATR